jgi:hypothetical protein
MKVGFIKRIFGGYEAKYPKDPTCWKYSNGRVEIEWARSPELREPCGALRLEGRGLPERILVIYGIDGQYHAFRDRVSYWGGRLDPVPGTAKVRCYGLRTSTFDYAGNVMSGPAKEPLQSFRVETKKCKMIIS